MARTKKTAKKYGKPLITWTRFHLPREQEWPTWTVDHADVHIGPFAKVLGVQSIVGENSGKSRAGCLHSW